MRCLKRYIAREVYRALIAIRNGEAGREPAVERGARLREVRVSLGKTQQQVGDALGVPSSRVSEIERGFGICPNSNDKSSSGWTQSSGKANTPTHLTMYRSIKKQSISSIELTDSGYRSIHAVREDGIASADGRGTNVPK